MNEKDKTKLVEVYKGSLWEAELLKTRLDDCGIECALKDGHVVNVVLPAAAVEVRVLVNEVDFESAMVVVRDYEERKHL